MRPKAPRLLFSLEEVEALCAQAAAREREALEWKLRRLAAEIAAAVGPGANFPRLGRRRTVARA